MFSAKGTYPASFDSRHQKGKRSPQCSAVKKDGTRCKCSQVWYSDSLCKTHEGLCEAIGSDAFEASQAKIKAIAK